MCGVYKMGKIKKIMIGIVIIYVGYILVQQQITLNLYKVQEKYYEEKILAEKDKTNALKKQKMLYNTDMYIEKIARDKLGLVKPGERVFIDISD